MHLKSHKLCDNSRLGAKKNISTFSWKLDWIWNIKDGSIANREYEIGFEFDSPPSYFVWQHIFLNFEKKVDRFKTIQRLRLKVLGNCTAMASEEKNLTEESKTEEERPDQRTDNPTEVDDDRGGDLVIDEPEEKPDGDGESDERVRDILLFI